MSGTQRALCLPSSPLSTLVLVLRWMVRSLVPTEHSFCASPQRPPVAWNCPACCRLFSKSASHPPDTSTFPQLLCGKSSQGTSTSHCVCPNTPRRVALSPVETWALHPLCIIVLVMLLCMTPWSLTLCLSCRQQPLFHWQNSCTRLGLSESKRGHVTLSSSHRRSSWGEACHRYCLTDD